MMKGWRLEAIVSNYDELTTTIDWSEELLNKMRKVKLLTAAKREEIQNMGKDMQTRVRLFLDHLEKRPEDEFDLFCQCLIDSLQPHIVKDYLTIPRADQEAGKPLLPKDQPSLKDSPSLASGKQPENVEKPELEYKMLEVWQRARIEKNRVDLTTNINLSPVLRNYLVQANILTGSDRDRIQRMGQENTEQVGHLLDFLLRRPAADYDKFCECLGSSNQMHIVKAFLKR